MAPRFGILLFVAALAHPVVYILFSGLLEVTDFSNTAGQMESWLDIHVTLLLVGFGIQLAAIILQIAAMMTKTMWRPHAAFAGSFLAWPRSRQTVPYDFVGLAILAYVLPLGLPVTSFVLLEHTVHISPHPIDSAAVMLAVMYALLVMDVTFNNGNLRFFDWGDMPAAPALKQSKPDKFLASIQKTAKPTKETLGDIFSRRDNALRQIAQSEEK